MDLVQYQIPSLAIHSPDPTKAAGGVDELVQWQMQSIHGLAIHSPESNKSSRWSLMDLVQ